MLEVHPSEAALIASGQCSGDNLLNRLDASIPSEQQTASYSVEFIGILCTFSVILSLASDNPFSSLYA